MVGENGVPETPDWHYPAPRTKPPLIPELANVELDGLGEN